MGLSVSAGDETLAAAIFDRLLHASHVPAIKGRSYPLRDLEATLANLANLAQADSPIEEPHAVAHAMTSQ